jgi:hypothetical protein
MEPGIKMKETNKPRKILSPKAGLLTPVGYDEVLEL